MLHLFLYAFAASIFLMFILWLIHIAIKNVGIIDFGWVSSIVLCALIYFFLSDGYLPRKILVTGMALFWGLRLGGYILFARVIGKHEDPRYAQFRKASGWITWGNFFLFFQFQALIAFVFSFSFIFADVNPEPRLSIFESLGLVLWFIAVNGEAIADRQLHQFKQDPASKGKACRAGLWKYSRHPNYFFEWLIWVSFFIFSLSSPLGFISIVSPALILYFLLKVTGIPATEAQSLKTKGDDYRDYQRTTSVFIPWFPKK